MFARKPDGSSRICYGYQGLNTITWSAVEQLQHLDVLLDGTRESSFFSKLDLTSTGPAAITSCGCGPRI